MSSRLKYPVIILAVVLLFPMGKALLKKSDPSGGSQDPSIPVRVQKVHVGDIQKALEYVGNVKAQAEVMIYPKVSGKVIEKIKEEGAEVNPGDVIAYIDRDEIGLKFEKAPVESPIKGVIGRVFVDIGSHVTSPVAGTSQTAVAMVIDMDTMIIDLDIPEIYLPKVSLGQQAAVSFDAYPGEKFTGTVKKVSPVLNLLNRAAPVEIQIDNKDHRLKSGMFARVILPLEKHERVPILIKEAVIGQEPEAHVYVIENGKAFSRKVTLGIREAEKVEVTTGVKEGELVVVMGQQRLYDDAPVRVEIDEAEGDGR
ncbi:MAG TPA: efflux RND transporter periplasmic adaptor subunit [Candidatus Omnitrophota bacterium]|nr:efflux RND transporter periplasmic adaptor subunit [Candidatus Omnitrophota bacterium]HPB68458.1 efflux RND transporter periplasmic adaptor subunit [Candidatus Omnitrophota bacterium]HQO58976.1 efflux RND transporter periplasmic adaptor subunit [Candidatus Omnitrophota bacterium]